MSQTYPSPAVSPDGKLAFFGGRRKPTPDDPSPGGFYLTNLTTAASRSLTALEASLAKRCEAIVKGAGRPYVQFSGFTQWISDSRHLIFGCDGSPIWRVNSETLRATELSSECPTDPSLKWYRQRVFTDITGTSYLRCGQDAPNPPIVNLENRRALAQYTQPLPCAIVAGSTVIKLAVTEQAWSPFSGGAGGCAWSRRGDRIAILTATGSLVVSSTPDPADGRIVAKVGGRIHQWSHNDRRILFSSGAPGQRGFAYFVVDVSGGKLPRRFRNTGRYALFWYDDNHVLGCDTPSPGCTVIDVRTDRRIPQVLGCGVNAVAYRPNCASADQQLVVRGGYAGPFSVYQWDAGCTSQMVIPRAALHHWLPVARGASATC